MFKKDQPQYRGIQTMQHDRSLASYEALCLLDDWARASHFGPPTEDTLQDEDLGWAETDHRNLTTETH